MRIARKVRKLAPYVHGEQPRGRDVIKLNTNEAAYLPSAKAMSVLKKFDPELLRRYPSAECVDLCAALAKLHRTTPDRVFVGNGSDEVLSLMTDAFVEDDESIVTLDPSYSLYKTLADIRGVKWVGGSWEELCRKATCDGALALITSPNNPTGVQIPPKEIAAFAKRFPGVVVVDEAYVDYADADCMALATAKTNRNIIDPLNNNTTVSMCSFFCKSFSVGNHLRCHVFTSLHFNGQDICLFFIAIIDNHIQKLISNIFYALFAITNFN